MALTAQPVVYYLAVTGDENSFQNESDMQGKYISCMFYFFKEQDITV